MRNSIEFEITGNMALFTDPLMGYSGGRCSLPVPTYSVLRGLCNSIYRSPRFEWVIAAVRVMNTVRMEEIPHFSRYHEGAELNCCLRDVRYQVRAQLVRTERKSEYSGIPEAYSIALRSLKRGGRRMTYLGKREYGCDIKPCVFGEGFCCYQGVSWDMGMMFHSFAQRGGVPVARLFRCRMDDGMIRFPPPSECTISCIVDERSSDALA